MEIEEGLPVAKGSEIVLHWEHLKTNFVNKERGLSSKFRLGHKANNMQLTTTIKVYRDRIDLKYKQEIEAALWKVAPALHRDMSVVVYIGGHRYNLSARNFKTLSNNLANLLIQSRQLADKKSYNKIIVGKKFTH